MLHQNIITNQLPVNAENTTTVLTTKKKSKNFEASKTVSSELTQKQVKAKKKEKFSLRSGKKEAWYKRMFLSVPEGPRNMI